MGSNSNQLRILMSVGVIILLAGILIFAAVMPLLSKVRASQARIKAGQEKIAELDIAISNYRQVVTKLDKVNDTAGAVLGIFPVREDSVALVEALEASIQKSGINASVNIIDPAEDQQRNVPPTKLIKNLSGVEEVPYSLNILGSYRQIVNLFSYFENMPYFTEISKLSLSSVSTSDQGGKNVRRTGEGAGELRGVLFIKSQ